MPENQLSEKLKFLLKSQKVKPPEFANRARITVATVYNVINAETKNASFKMYKGIFSVFPNVNPQWLFNDAEPIFLEGNEEYYVLQEPEQQYGKATIVEEELAKSVRYWREKAERAERKLLEIDKKEE